MLGERRRFGANSLGDTESSPRVFDPREGMAEFDAQSRERQDDIE
jgi:hypothetical protein